MSILTLNFNADPNIEKYRVSYRPKGSTQSYFIVDIVNSPINISTNVITNVDYEGYLQGMCNGKLSKGKSFTTSKYNNAIGSVSVADCNTSFTGNVTSVTFNGVQLLPLIPGIVLSEGVQQDFISNIQGTGNLVINHSFSNCNVTVKDSTGTEITKISTVGSITFSTINITSVQPFLITISCIPLSV